MTLRIPQAAASLDHNSTEIRQRGLQLGNRFCKNAHITARAATREKLIRTVRYSALLDPAKDLLIAPGLNMIPRKSLVGPHMDLQGCRMMPSGMAAAGILSACGLLSAGGANSFGGGYRSTNAPEGTCPGGSLISNNIAGQST